MFNTYKSKGGFTVIGTKPMFEDVESEVLGITIKAKLLEVFGFYPILDVSETWVIERDFMGEELENGPVEMRDYHAIFDTEKLDLVDSWNISYVQFLFERIIKDRMVKPDAKHIDTYASKKYCFSDTEDWWDKMQIEEVPEGREKIELIVTLG